MPLKFELSANELKNAVDRFGKYSGLLQFAQVDTLPEATSDNAFSIINVRRVPGTSQDKLYICLADSTSPTGWQWCLITTGEDELLTLTNGDDADSLHGHASLNTSYLLKDAVGMTEPGTSGATDGQIDGTNISYEGRLFDPSADEHADFNHFMPSDYDGGNINGRFIWTAASGSGTVNWKLFNVGHGDDDAIDVALTEVVDVTDTLIATGDLHIITFEWSSNLPTPGEHQFYRITRDVSEDNLNADAMLVELVLDWTR